jgi:hypothetical protein
MAVAIAVSDSGEDTTLLRETGKELATDCELTSDEALLCSSLSIVNNKNEETSAYCPVSSSDSFLRQNMHE